MISTETCYVPCLVVLQVGTALVSLLLMGLGIKLVLNALTVTGSSFLAWCWLVLLFPLASFLVLPFGLLLIICALLPAHCYLMSLPEALSEGCLALASGCLACLEATGKLMDAVGRFGMSYQWPSLRHMAATVSQSLSEIISGLEWDVSVCDGRALLHRQLSMPPHFSAPFFSSQPPPTCLQLGLEVCVRI
jgi:hypothetical protein